MIKVNKNFGIRISSDNSRLFLHDLTTGKDVFYNTFKCALSLIECYRKTRKTAEIANQIKLN